MRGAVFARETTECRHVSGNRAEIAAGNRARPRGARAEFLQVVERLPRHAKKAAGGKAARKAERDEHLRRGFDQRQRVSRDKSARSMIRGLGRDGNLNRRAPERERDAPRETQGAGVAFHGKNHAAQIGDGALAERLKWVQGGNGGAAAGERGEQAMVEGAARVEHDFALERRHYAADVAG